MPAGSEAAVLRLSISDLREHALAATFFKPTTLRQAIERLGFVQADPIQAPASAQDLILRHRVNEYHAGDLERQYRRLGIEEDRLYAYGFMPRSTWRLLHPRIERTLNSTEKRVLQIAVAVKRIHPDDLEVLVGRKIVENDWGGKSRESTRALHSLHFGGFLRVAERVGRIRVYEAVPHHERLLDRATRFRQLVLLVASVLAPISETSLAATLGYAAYRAPGLRGLRTFVPKLVGSGDLVSASVDGIRYLWPSNHRVPDAPHRKVRFLAPFDPLVWDRRRFEHLWGWPYRFEAYLPAAKRQLGYYAMPMLWRDDVIGWVHTSHRSGKLIVERGFQKGIPRERAFETEYEAEVARLERFLKRRK